MEIPGYTIIRKIGKGGMATVYLAIQESLDRQVALKVMEATRVKDENFTERFLKEGRIIAQFQHPQIITIYDFGSQEPYHYFSMEFLPEGTLAQQIERGLTLQRSLDIIKLIAEALAYAHKRGVIHRDIKPQNILFRQDGTPVLSDFGIAKMMDANTQLTAPGLTIGSPVYMSPEQVTGQRLDSRSDLYSLGIVFYEMLTQQPPYRADDMISIAMMHCTQPVPRLPMEFGQLQPVLQKLLAKKPADRFESAEQFIHALDQPRTPLSFDLLRDTTRIVQSIKTSLRPNKSWLVGGLLLLIAAVGSTLYLIGFRQPTPPAAGIGAMELPPAAGNRSDITTYYEQLAIKHFQQGEFEQSLELIKLGLNTSPTDARLLTLREQTQRYQDATRLLEQAQQRDREGMIDQSLQLVEEGLRRVPDHHGLVMLRDTLQTQRQQRWQQADQFLLQARALLQQGALEDSLKLTEQGLQQVPGHPDLLNLRDQVKAAIETHHRIAQLLRDCATRFQPDRLSAQTGGEAVACYNQIINLAPNNSEARAKLEQLANQYADWASDAIRQADFPRAEDCLAQLSRIKPDHPQFSSLNQALQVRRAQAAIEARQKADSETRRQAAEEAKRQAAAARRQAAEEAKRRLDEQAKKPLASPIPKPGIAQPSKQAKPESELAGQPRPKRSKPDCREALLKAQLGEPMSTTEQEACRP